MANDEVKPTTADVEAITYWVDPANAAILEGLRQNQPELAEFVDMVSKRMEALEAHGVEVMIIKSGNDGRTEK